MVEEKLQDVEIQDNKTNNSLNEIEFLIKLLDKQFELVGAPYTTEQVMQMDMETQQELWSSYILTKEQYTEWYQYFISIKDSVITFQGLDDIVCESIFANIVTEWGFNIEGIEYDNEDVDEIYEESDEEYLAEFLDEESTDSDE